MKTRIILSLICLILALGSCSSKGSKKGDDLDGALSESDLNAKRDSRYGSGSIPAAEGEGLFRDIRFAYDSYQISDSGQQDIDYNAQVLKEHPNWNIQLEGHTDERGTSDYNMALGEQRARAVQEILTSLGVSSRRITTISYGEDVPLDPGQSESAFAKNRRVHFSAFAEGTR